MTKRMLYWAYGSNLNVEAMTARCPGAVMVGPLYLDRAALVFRSVADVVGRRKSKVAGGLWEITREDELVLDRYEGVSSGLYSKLYIKLPGKGDVLYYKMNEAGVRPPPDYYLNIIVQGYRDFGLDLELLDRAVTESWNNKNITPYLNWRHKAKGSPNLAVSRGLSVRDFVIDPEHPERVGKLIRITKKGNAEVQWPKGIKSYVSPHNLERVEAPPSNSSTSATRSVGFWRGKNGWAG